MHTHTYATQTTHTDLGEERRGEHLEGLAHPWESTGRQLESLPQSPLSKKGAASLLLIPAPRPLRPSREGRTQWDRLLA